MSATKGVQRRSRHAGRDDLSPARWWIPTELHNATKAAAKESGLSEGLYIELLLSRLAEQSGSLPRFTTTTAQELPIADVA
ncbi:hypothetical protein [Clavibacter michiganensis]|uniref:hypothetical protein n=1 Tax=Clavibacter michiganensis TaxID=28447 RepID=UPI001365AD38|nr:hypothetical protein [Clavibacter michiganensis]MDO4070333.1 hypothetical protein [Clavibacter michiganensis]MWJ49047.1 hypothetical protein [Clavibacter michiganensis subsp. michiganensis]